MYLSDWFYITCLFNVNIIKITKFGDFIILKILSFLFLIPMLLSCSSESDTSGLVADVLNSSDIPASTEVVNATLTSMTLFSDKTSLPVGETTNLSAYGRFSDFSIRNITDEIVWSSADSSKASVSGKVATATGAGSVELTATLDGVSETLVIVPFSANVVSLDFNFNNLILPSDGKAIVVVSALYDNGMSVDVTSNATISIDDTSVATVDSVSSFGEVSAVSNGSAVLSASYGGQTKNLSINITTAVIESIQVTPIIGSKSKNETQQFYATATLDDGSTLDVSSAVSWTSSDTSIMTIDSSGVASLLTAGSSTIEASYSGQTNSVNFTVLDKTLSSLDLTLSSDSLTVGVLGSASVIATYSDSSSEDVTNSVSFSSSDNSVAIISNNTSSKGDITTLAAGTADITATLNSISTTKTLTITSAALVSIEVLADSTLLSAGINAYYTAKGTYDDASVVDITKSVTWSISENSYGSISNAQSNRGFFTNSFVDANTQTMTVSANLDGVSGSQDIILAPGTITSISINPSQATMNTSSNVDFKAYANYSDGAAVEITSIVTWNSSDADIVMASNSLADAGRISSIGEGSASIQASYNGMNSSSSSITVDNTQTPQVPEQGDGLLAQYFNGNSFNTLAGSRVDSNIDFNWATGSAPLGVDSNFSVRWTGQIKGKFTGDCQVSSRSDDGFRIWIGGNSIIDVWFPHAPRWDHNYSVPFVEGEKQTITVEFFENGGHAVSELYWQCPGDAALEPIPTEYLFSE